MLPKKLKSNLNIINQLLMIFYIPFITTFLLDIPVVAQSIARQILVYFLLILEIGALITILIYNLTLIKKP